MANLLTAEQVKDAIYADDDFPREELERYARSASSYIKHKSGYDFAKDTEIEPLAIECAILFVKQLHFGYDFEKAINSFIVDLQVIADAKAKEDS